MSPVLRLGGEMWMDGWMDGSVVYMLGIIENDAVVVPVTSFQCSPELWHLSTLETLFQGFSVSESRQGDGFQHKWLYSVVL